MVRLDRRRLIMGSFFESARGLARWGRLARCGSLLLAALLFARFAAGQGAVAVTQQRPFVIGLVPVVGAGGAVGGVSIDAQGVVARSDVDQTQRLRDARLKALAEVDSELRETSPMRKVS